MTLSVAILAQVKAIMAEWGKQRAREGAALHVIVNVIPELLLIEHGLSFRQQLCV